ncbi:unnamed protein product [Toxocara canis]|uniref:Recep_L_domain domain-containing protein n=1 Tax=Toxocara canis TaxID=6265 RepID=A0A183UAD6_TOXCA|nr:unnamed protein product [Toxocara canis]
MERCLTFGSKANSKDFVLHITNLEFDNNIFTIFVAIALRRVRISRLLNINVNKLAADDVFLHRLVTAGVAVPFMPSSATF